MAQTPTQSDPAATGLDQFLQPQSMVTPGVLGTVAMFGTNTLCTAFPVAPVYVALGLSFFFGIVTIVKTPGLIEKAVYYVVNSLIILSMAFGTNSIGLQSAHRIASLDQSISITSWHLITPAQAQTKDGSGSGQFFRPWTLTPTPPAASSSQADVPKPPSGGVVPFRLTAADGTCTTIFLPADDPKAMTALQSKDLRVSPGACPAK